ncbi:phage tail assembly chaperone [Achromobacter xylosoxidans]
MAQISRLRWVAADPLAGFKHESVTVPEWEGATVIVRAPSPGDHLFHIRAIWAAAGVDPGEDQDSVRAKLDAPGVDYTRASASLLVRTLFEQTEHGPRRVFGDDDVDMVAAAYGPAHATLVAKAIELGNLGEGAQERAKKPSRKRQTSVS